MVDPSDTQYSHSRLLGDVLGEVEIDHEAREVTMSMIFKWYKADFGPPDVMLPWLLQARRLGILAPARLLCFCSQPASPAGIRT